MAGQQQSQRGFGSQYPSGQMRVPNYGQAQPDNDEYAQACSHLSQQLRAQIGDQRPAWDGQIPGFWDRLQPPQQQQSHAMNQQNQFRRSATNFGQDQQQQYMGDDETSHFHAQGHFRASQLHKGGGGGGGGREGGGGGHGGANSGILPSAGMQQAPGQYNGQHHNTNHQSATMPGPNSFMPGQPGTFGQGRNQPGYAPSQSNPQMYPSRTNRGWNNNSMNGYNAQ